MATHTFIDCNGLAGFMSYGCVSAGMDMVLRTGTLNFGAPMTEANRHLLGAEWNSDFSDDPQEWPRKKADAIIGCPPCSGWSVWSGAANRGPDAAAHEHTRAFMRYAAIIKPQIIVFECVQQAYTQGRETMIKYRDMVEQLSGKKYDLHHVMHNNLQLGGFSYRPRYFWVATRKGMKFTTSVVEPKTAPTVMDVIGDLAELPIQWEEQKIVEKSNPHIKWLRQRGSMVEGHMTIGGIHEERINDIFGIVGNEGWKNGEILQEALKRAVDKNNGRFPQSWITKEKKIRERNFILGYSQPGRWPADSYAHVLTGGAMFHVVHPTQPRLLTHRECARIQGLPDTWKIADVRDYSNMKATWGKAVAAQAGQWIGKTVIDALDEKNDGVAGEKIGDREYMHQTDKGFSRQAAKKKWYSKQ